MNLNLEKQINESTFNQDKSKLDEIGYVYFPKFFDATTLRNVQSTIVEQEINYTQMDDFIRNNFMKKIDGELNWESKFTKYRVSNNNNSSDASILHRDVIQIKENDVDMINSFNLYTCLTYLDPSTMQIIPKSHKNPHANFFSALSNFHDTITINMEPGDVLVFNAKILHRGVFDSIKMTDQRRLIQVFDVHPTLEQYKKHAQDVLHIPSSGVRSSSSKLVSWLGHAPVISSIMSYISHLNASTGYGYGDHLLDLLKKYNLQDYHYLSSEGMQKRLDIKGITTGESNRYVLNDIVKDLEPPALDDILMQCYTKWLTIYSTLLFLILIIVISLFYFGVKHLISWYKGTKADPVVASS